MGALGAIRAHVAPDSYGHRLRALVAGFRGALSRQTRAVHRGQLRFVGTIAPLRVHIRHGFERVGLLPVGALPLLGQVYRTFLSLVGKFQVAVQPRETERDGDPGPLGALDSDKPTSRSFSRAAAANAGRAERSTSTSSSGLA